MNNPNGAEKLLPVMMGTEHELSICAAKREQQTTDDHDSIQRFLAQKAFEDVNEEIYDSAKNSNDTLWSDEEDGAGRILLENGGIFQGFGSSHPLEYATPECSSPKELLLYSKAASLAIEDWITDALKNDADYLRAISHSHRVIDSVGTIWGEHDNFATHEDEEWGMGEDTTPDILWLHILSRGIVSGAGFVNSEGEPEYHASQKLPTLSEKYNKMWGSTAMYGWPERFEVRCSDKNISEWAHVIRLGSMALVMALAREGFSAQDLAGYASVPSLNACYDFNQLEVGEDGTLRIGKSAEALDIQLQLAFSAVELTRDWRSERGSEYRSIAKSWLNFCSKLHKASRGN